MRSTSFLTCILLSIPFLTSTLAVTVPKIQARAASASTCSGLATASSDIASGISLLNAAVKGGNLAVAPYITQAETAQSDLQIVRSGAGCITKRDAVSLQKRQGLIDVAGKVIQIVRIVGDQLDSEPAAQEKFRSADTELLPLLPLLLPLLPS